MKHRRLITLLLVAAIVCGLLPMAVSAAPDGAVTVSAPDDSGTSISVWLDGGKAYYEVKWKGVTMIEASTLGLRTSLGDLNAGFTMGTVTRTSSNTTWKPVVGEQETYRDWYNAASVPLTKDGLTLTLEIRAYPEGVAFRYVLPQSSTDWTVTGEDTTFTFPQGTKASLHIGGHQTVPIEYDVSTLPAGSTYHRPSTMKYTGGQLLTICEGNLDHYCEMQMKKGSAARSIAVQMGSTVTVTENTPSATPWRVLVMGDNETDLASHNYLSMNLNETPDEATYKFSEWVESKSCVRAASGMNTTAINAIVDQAAREGIGYVLLDTGWYGPEYDTNCDPRLDPSKLDLSIDSDKILAEKYFATEGGWNNTGEGVFNTRGVGFNVYGKLGTSGTFQTNVDIPAICAHANEKGVGIILYVNGKFFPDQGVDNDGNKRNRFTPDELFAYFEKWGVAGVKPGFVNKGSQANETYMEEVVQAAAKHHLILTVHDEWVPAGMERTYPNLFCTEGILGDEGIGRKSDGQIPQDIATLFTRPIQGATDHTFCYPGKGTKAYALASSIMFRTGMSVIYWYGNPDQAMSATGDSMNFWENLPCNWDESLYLEGSMYEYATYARRAKGTDDWYIGSLSAIDRTLNLKLDFLDKDVTYVAEIWADGVGVDGTGGTAKNRNKDVLEEKSYLVTSETVLSRELHYGYGYAVRIKKATAEQLATLSTYNVDNERLTQSIEAAKLYKNEGYTTDSYAALQSAISAAEALLKDASATTAQKTQAIANINAAIAGLTSTAALQDAIAAASRLAEYHYTAASWQPLADAVSAGEALLQTTFTQAQLDAATKAIEDAIEALVEDPNSTVSTTTYLSDLTYSKTVSGTNNIKRDTARDGTKLSLMVDGTFTEFDKGMAFDAPGGLYYDLTNQNVDVFEAYVGVDAEKKAQGDIIFRVYGDGKLLYESKASGNGSQNAQHFSIPVRGVKELYLEGDMNGSKDGDWADWADAKFITWKNPNQAIKGITVDGAALNFNANTTEYYYPASTNGQIPQVAAVLEEGGTAVVTQAAAQPGKATIVGTSSNGNTKTYTIYFCKTEDSDYLSDKLDLVTANTMYNGGKNKDKNYSGLPISLYGENGTEVTYAKGVGTHAQKSTDSSLTFNIEGLGYDRFETWVGVDYYKCEHDTDGAGHRSKVQFRIYVDGVLAAESGVSEYQTPAQFLSVDVRGAKTLRLQVDALGDQSADHSNWADAKFLKYIDKSALETLYNAHKDDAQGDYSDSSWQTFTAALAAANTVLNNDNATQTEIDTAKANLTTAISSLHAHNWATGENWSKDASGHWHACSGCSEKKDFAQHTPDREAATETEPVKCSDCGYVIQAATGHIHHTTTLVPAVTPTCCNTGNTAYYTCSGCSDWFEDADGTTVIADHSTVELGKDPANHVGGTEVRGAQAATYTEEGYTGDTWCLGCNTPIATGTAIPKLTASSSQAGTPAQQPFNPNAGQNTVSFPFVDVPSGKWYYSSVKSAWEKGLIDGVNANEFKPDAKLTVAQAIKLAAALHQLDKTGAVSLTNGSPWYSSYVNYAVANGIIEGAYANYTAAELNATITREEFVHILNGAMDDYAAKNSVADNAIPDVKTTDKYGAEIYEFYRAGILTGSDANGTFNGENSIKRSEVAAILVRMYDASARQSIALK